MAKMESLLICFIIFSLFSLSSPLPLEAVIYAATILLDSGFISMALTLRLVSQALIPQPPSATIFSPFDAACAKFGQPLLSLLKLHFSPLAFSIESLRSLPYGTKIPTLFPGRSLIVITWASNEQISLNNVTINGLPIYDDRTSIIVGMEKFFDPIFHVSAPIQSPSPNVGCILSMNNLTPSSSGNSFDEASELLRSNGYSVMASFLDLQLLGLFDHPEMTVFAPINKVMVKHVGNFTENSLLFLRHVLPCKLTRADLVNFRDRTVFRIALEDLSHVFSSVRRDLNFIDHTSDLGWKESQRLQPIVVDPGLYLARMSQIFYATEKRPMPDAFKVFAGKVFSLYPIDFLVKNYTGCGAAFARQFQKDDPVLNIIDEKILRCGRNRAAPGAWGLVHWPEELVDGTMLTMG
ncbi:hypothetical protein F0562_034061 [Nyssa sinensis]|uniref:FAS1 domain-containing protein n=1 Tax=Nyssa sinensis TaxID=561372 RepID=A0A5J5AEZ3_9ASTE|nr:hypothetical protein F0562_034061 [Nyssa sinensis]